MRIAVLSDIHGNMEAFEQVLADVEASGVDKIISLGDNIGYGPESERVISVLRDRNIPSVMGNHELAVADPNYLNWFNPVARRSLEKTLDMLSDLSIEFSSNLEPYLTCDNCRFVHGFPPDSITTYLFEISENGFFEIMKRMTENICFIGHTHNLEIADFDGVRVERGILTEGLHHLHTDRKYIINIGSVGQPRDGNNRAKYIIWDTSAHTIEVKFLPYDISSVVAKIRQAGLPEAHARRLL
jgi:predicted phosphodiesterase